MGSGERIAPVLVTMRNFQALAANSRRGQDNGAETGLPDPEKTLEDLMAGYQRAEHAAASELIHRVSPLLYRFLSSPTATREYGEDLLQECWMRVHKARHSYRPGEPVLPWLFAIARHTRVDGYRRRRRVDWHEIGMEQVPETAAPAIPSVESGDENLVHAIDSLPESQREVLYLLKVCGMTLEEVARATAVTVGAVKQKAHRAYEKLRTELRKPAPALLAGRETR